MTEVLSLICYYLHVTGNKLHDHYTMEELKKAVKDMKSEKFKSKDMEVSIIRHNVMICYACFIYLGLGFKYHQEHTLFGASCIRLFSLSRLFFSGFLRHCNNGIGHSPLISITFLWYIFVSSLPGKIHFHVSQDSLVKVNLWK